MTKSKLNEMSAFEVHERVRKMIARHELEVAEVSDGLVKKVNAPKTGNNTTSYAMIEKLNVILKKHGFVLESDKGGKKRYRRRQELPDPTARADTDVNRLRKMFQVRVLPEIKDKVDAAAAKEGMTRQDWVERALLNALENRN